MTNDNPTLNQSPAASQPAGAAQSRNKALLVAIIALTVLIGATIVGYILTRPNAAAGGPVAQVAITDEGFDPAVIQVKRGQMVTWINQHAESEHHVIGDTSLEMPTIGFDSGNSMSVGDSFSYKFEETGTFTYSDKLNPITYKGTVTVVE